MSKRVLAFDFGASSGRAILGAYADGKIELKEIHRFSNDPVEINGTLYWDVLRLFHEIKQGSIPGAWILALWMKRDGFWPTLSTTGMNAPKA